MERVRGAADKIRHDDEPPSVQKRSPKLPHREVEREGMKERPHIRGAKVKQRFGRREQTRDVGVRHAHTFGASRRSRRVDHVRKVVRSDVRTRIVDASVGRPIEVEQNGA